MNKTQKPLLAAIFMASLLGIASLAPIYSDMAHNPTSPKAIPLLFTELYGEWKKDQQDRQWMEIAKQEGLKRTPPIHTPFRQKNIPVGKSSAIQLTVGSNGNEKERINAGSEEKATSALILKKENGK